MPNQHKPLRECEHNKEIYAGVNLQQHICVAPENELREWGEYYWDLGLPDTKVTEMLQAHFDTTVYGLR